MAEFKLAYQKSMNHEGSYSNDPRDRGGETWKGISRKNWPDWEGWKIIDSVEDKKAINKKLNSNKELEQLVQDFYKTNFWDVLKLDQIEVQAIAEELFDTGINTGLNTAARHFQHALNLMNRNQKDYADLQTDGKLGERSLKCFEAYMNTAKTIPGRNIELLTSAMLKALNGMQFNLYVEICKNNPEQESFFFGWVTNRT